jgi:hypothetical protein
VLQHEQTPGETHASVPLAEKAEARRWANKARFPTKGVKARVLLFFPSPPPFPP